jgi:hypothetical protein
MNPQSKIMLANAFSCKLVPVSNERIVMMMMMMMMCVCVCNNLYVM